MLTLLPQLANDEVENNIVKPSENQPTNVEIQHTGGELKPSDSEVIRAEDSREQDAISSAPYFGDGCSKSLDEESVLSTTYHKLQAPPEEVFVETIIGDNDEGYLDDIDIGEPLGLYGEEWDYIPPITYESLPQGEVCCKKCIIQNVLRIHIMFYALSLRSGRER